MPRIGRSGARALPRTGRSRSLPPQEWALPAAMAINAIVWPFFFYLINRTGAVLFSMMNVVRVRLQDLLRREAIRAGWSMHEQQVAIAAVDKLLDMELAIMLETFHEDYMTRLRANERLASLGQLAASIGHELRNPLAVIDSSLHLLKRRVSDDARIAKHVDRIGQQVGRSNRIITDLLELARDRAPNRVVCDLPAIVEATVQDLEHKGVELTVDLDHVHGIWVDLSQIQQVVFNLVQNAIHAAQSRPPLNQLR